MRLLVTVLFLALSVVSYAEPIDFASEECGKHLFSIAKSDNKNVLYYDANLKEGKFVSKTPVNIYWIMYQEKGQTEGLTFLEKPHFGITVKEVKAGEEYTVNVRDEQLVGKNIRVFLDEKGCPRATTKLSGTDVLFSDVFINISPDSGFLPDVQNLDLKGHSLADGNTVTERINAKK